MLGGRNFATVTPPSTASDPSAGATPLHSGAHKRRVRTQFRYHDSEFRCGQLNILVALTDIGPGDGATMIVPGRCAPAPTLTSIASRRTSPLPHQRTTAPLFKKDTRPPRSPQLPASFVVF